MFFSASPHYVSNADALAHGAADFADLDRNPIIALYSIRAFAIGRYRHGL